MKNSDVSDSPNLIAIEQVEPAFHPLSGYSLRIGRSDRSMLNHLAACIETRPADLLTHTRRILMTIDLQDQDELFGAMVDLFIAKEHGAFNARSNLLQRCSGLLSAQQQSFLRNNLENGITAYTPVAAPCSRLTAGVLGTDFAVINAS